MNVIVGGSKLLRMKAIKSRRWLAVAAKVNAINRVRGTRDLLVKESQLLRDTVDVMQHTVERYGFRSIQTPLLEYTDLYLRSLGDGSDIVMKEMYTFKDNSGKSVSLRPEGTAGVIRALVNNNLMFSLPQKVSYSGSMFRYERPQRGRYREFQQFGKSPITMRSSSDIRFMCIFVEGVEFVGSSCPSVDAEVIAMAADALDALGIASRVTLELNSLGDMESRARYRTALEVYFLKHKNELSSGSIDRLERGSVLRILDSKSERDQRIAADAPQLCDFLSDESKMRFNSTLCSLDALNVRYRHNHRLVRGLDYYSNTVFEFVENPYTSDIKQATVGGIAVLAGGCYDELTASFGGPVASCVGWAAGVDRLNLLRDVQAEATSSSSVAVSWLYFKGDNSVLLMHYIDQIVPVFAQDSSRVLHEALRIAQLLRRREFIVHVCHGNGNMKKQMKIAERSGSSHAIILGEQEIEKQVAKIKNLNKREETIVTMQELNNYHFD
ncbi:uncharacterized protein CCR75_002118 [Bremia lactucae]|uniref:histidine--tRNA ligase n=1 Tax=Bremia lactucae TaxID=4779 RepID=A0A976FD23_BRELC|nr:hypothetical protein CCR75_002118 [Bremia lactucae]